MITWLLIGIGVVSLILSLIVWAALYVGSKADDTPSEHLPDDWGQQ